MQGSHTELLRQRGTTSTYRYPRVFCLRASWASRTPSTRRFHAERKNDPGGLGSKTMELHAAGENPTAGKCDDQTPGGRLDHRYSLLFFVLKQMVTVSKEN